jgi:DNA repair exonuclease SbcCD ATPase subunit
MNNSTLRLFVRSIIAEAKKAKKMSSVDGRLKMIDEAGDKAALQAKINKIEEDIQEAKSIMSAIPSEINQYVDKEIIGDLMDDIKNSIVELENKKKELEEQMKGMEKPVKEAKPKKKEEIEEARFPKGTDIGKPGKGFAKIAKSAAKKYGSKEAGQKVAGAILKKVVKK